MSAEQKALRKKILAMRENQGEIERVEKSLRIIHHYKEAEFFQGVDLILAYKSASGEVELDSLLKYFFRQNIPVAVPRVISGPKEDSRMEFVLVTDDTTYRKGAFQIDEPTEGEVIRPRQYEGKRIEVLLPGVCFDLSGGRIGYGGGYYDRAINQFKQSGGTMHLTALAFDLQIVDAFEKQSWDVCYDGLITEERFILR